MAYNEQPAHRVRDIITKQPGFVEKKMFGGVGFLLYGNMACGINKDDLIIRIGADNYSHAVMRPHTRPFDITGREMKGWVMVEPAGYAKPAVERRWGRGGPHPNSRREA